MSANLRLSGLQGAHPFEHSRPARNTGASLLPEPVIKELAESADRFAHRAEHEPQMIPIPAGVPETAVMNSYALLIPSVKSMIQADASNGLSMTLEAATAARMSFRLVLAG